MSYIYVVLSVACVVAVAAWLVISIRHIARHRSELERADKQLACYMTLCSRARNGQEKALALEQVEISREIYQNVALEYNLCLVRPVNLIPARILGYRPMQ